MVANAENILNDLIGRVARVRFWLVALGVLKTAAAGLVCVCLYVGLFVHQNVLYFSSYLSWLFRPLAQIEPVPATVLKPVTEDVVMARDAPVTLSAAIEGRTPESAAILLTPRASGDANDANAPPERIEIRPTVDSPGNSTLTATKSFDTLGRFSYQFQADGASSDIHTVKVCEPPAIKGMTATVSLPQTGKSQSATAYAQQVKESYAKATEKWSIILERFPDAPNIGPAALYFSGVCYGRMGDPVKAIECYRAFLEKWPDDERNHHVLLRLPSLYKQLVFKGVLTEQQANPIIQAAYEQFVEKYPNSPAAETARQSVRFCATEVEGQTHEQ